MLNKNNYIQTNDKNLDEVFNDKSIHKNLHARNYLNRLDNARREVEEKQKRLKWSSKNLKSGIHFRSSSMGEIDPEMYKKNENNNNNVLSNLKKNLREELNSLVILPNDSDGEYQVFKIVIYLLSIFCLLRFSSKFI